MRGPLRLRPLTSEEERVISKLARSQSASKRLVERAKIIQLAKEGQRIPQIMQQLHLSEPTVRKWWKRFEQQGLAGLEDASRPGAPSRYTPENKARVLEAALTRPSELNLLRTIASSYPGSARLFLYIRTAAREERVVAKLTVSASRKLVEALHGLVGRGEVWVE